VLAPTSTRVVERERDECSARGDCDVLLSARHVGDGRRGDATPGVEVPQLRTGPRVECVKGRLVSDEDQITGDGQNSTKAVPFILLAEFVLPLHDAGERIDCPH